GIREPPSRVSVAAALITRRTPRSSYLLMVAHSVREWSVARDQKMAFQSFPLITDHWSLTTDLWSLPATPRYPTSAASAPRRVAAPSTRPASRGQSRPRA